MIGRNNPLNIRYSPVNKWQGQSGYTKGFCNFRNIFCGIRAAAKLLMQSYPRQGFKTYDKIINRWAPPSENSTNNYLSYICDKCKVFPFDCPVSVEDYATLIYYMWCFEQGSKYRPDRTIADIELMINDIEIYGSPL